MIPRGVSDLRDMEQSEFKSVGEEDFTVEMQKLRDQIKEQLQNNNEEYKNRVDKHRRELQFEVGDQVLAHLSKERFPRGRYNKLKLKNIGPCKILRKFGNNVVGPWFWKKVKIKAKKMKCELRKRHSD
jgi:hypothetical protein